MNIPFRVTFTIGCILVGLVFPFVLLLAALTAWSIYEDLKGAHARQAADRQEAGRPRALQPEPEPEPDPDWRRRYALQTESPAERAFLEVMIDTHGLEPAGAGRLEGNLQLSLQVERPPYRLDFLVDDKLIVEIDGAAWHSSPEAVARDAVRDAHFTSRGYKVLRIPAKVTLYTPLEAVRLVGEARAQMAEGNAVLSALRADAAGAVMPTNSSIGGHAGVTASIVSPAAAPATLKTRQSGSMLGTMAAIHRRHATGRATSQTDPMMLAHAHCLEYVEEDREWLLGLHLQCIAQGPSLALIARAELAERAGVRPQDPGAASDSISSGDPPVDIGASPGRVPAAVSTPTPVARKTGSIFGPVFDVRRRQEIGKQAGETDPMKIAEAHCLECPEEDREGIMALHLRYIENGPIRIR